MPNTDIAFGSVCIATASPCIMESMIAPSCITTNIALATPTTSAPNTMDLAPTTNSDATLLGFNPPSTPPITPIARNAEAISWIYQPFLNTP